MASTGVADAVRTLNRNTVWTKISEQPLEGDLHHPQGMGRHNGVLHLSTVDTDTRTGWLLSYDAEHQLIGRTALGEGDRFHPGGFDIADGVAVIPVAEYRPDSSTIMARVELNTGHVENLFTFDDHLGGAAQLPNGQIVAATWGSRHLYRLDDTGTVLDEYPNAIHHVDFQDGQLDGDLWVCTGMAHLPGPDGNVEVGGAGIIDTDSLLTLFEAPVHLWSTRKHTAMRNPTLLRVEAGHLILEAVPDDGHATLITWTTPLTVPTS